MRHVDSGLAWSKAMLEDPKASREDQSLALSCLMSPGESWTRANFDALHSSRMAALRRFEDSSEWFDALCSSWAGEHAAFSTLDGKGNLVGFRSWIRAMEQAKDYGMSDAIQGKLAQSALMDKSMVAWLRARSDLDVESMFDSATNLSAKAHDEWQSELASRLSLSACSKRLNKAFFKNSQGDTSAFQGLSRGAAKVMAQKTLSDPQSAYELLDLVFFKDWIHRFDDRDPMAGLFDALADNPKPKLTPPGGKRTPKVFSGSKAPLSVSMQLMLDERFESGLAAAKWAAKLGSLGRHPVFLRQGGEKTIKFQPRVRLLSDASWMDGRLEVSSLQEVAFAMRKRPLALELEALGWRMPSKLEMADLIKRMEASISSSRASSKKSTPRWEGRAPIDQLGQASWAFWEELKLSRVVNVNSTIKKSLRM